METRESSQESILRPFLAGLADKLNDRVALKVFLQALPILWTTFVAQFWRTTFYTTNGSLNLYGGIIAALLSIVSIALLILTSVQSKHDKKTKERYDAEIDSYLNEVALRMTITDAECKLEERRNRHLRNWAESNVLTEQVCDFVTEARNPTERINSALDGLSECFGQVSGIARSNIYFSAAIAIVNVNSSKDPSWEWIAAPPMEGTASLETLIKSDSSFKVVARGTPFFYANDKKVAEEKGQYCFDEKDATYGNNGSIICCEFDEQIERFKIRMIMNISTYGLRILDDENPSESQIKTLYEDRIRDIILKQFEGEIKEDLLHGDSIYF